MGEAPPESVSHEATCLPDLTAFNPGVQQGAD